MTRWIALAVVWLAGSMALGCAGSSMPATQAVTTGSMNHTPEALDLLTLVGPDATGVLRADVRAALYHSWVRNLLEGLILTRSEGAREFMDGLDHTDELVIGFWDIPDEGTVPPMLLMARGDYRSIPMPDLAPAQTVAHYRQHELRAEDSSRVTVRLGDHTVMNGERELIVAVLDIVDGLAPATGPRGAVITAAMERVALRSHTFAFALGARVLMRPDATPFSDSPRVLGFWADIADTVTTEGFVTFADTNAPGVFLAVIEGTLQTLRGSPEVAALDLVAVLERIELRTEGNELLGRAALGSQDVERIRRALDTVVDAPTP